VEPQNPRSESAEPSDLARSHFLVCHITADLTTNVTFAVHNGKAITQRVKFSKKTQKNIGLVETKVQIASLKYEVHSISGRGVAKRHQSNQWTSKIKKFQQGVKVKLTLKLCGRYTSWKKGDAG
jgi:hypothetical protein